MKTAWSIIRDAVSRAERLGHEPMAYEVASAKLDQIARDADDAIAALVSAPSGAEGGEAEGWESLCDSEAGRHFFEYWRNATTCSCGRAKITAPSLSPAPAREGAPEIHMWNPLDREFLGAVVRRVWIEWAKEQPNPKPHWLTPWSELAEPDKEVDRRIGEAINVLSCGHSVAAPPAVVSGPEAEKADWWMVRRKFLKGEIWHAVTPENISGYGHDYERVPLFRHPPRTDRETT